MKVKNFTIHYEVDITLTEKELFPDGSTEEITVDKVKALIEKSGGFRKVLNDWYLYPYGHLTITEVK